MTMLKKIRDGAATKNKTWDINGVTVHYKTNPTGMSEREWRDIIEECFDIFESVGWLEEFNSLYVGKDAVSGTAVGRYTLDSCIHLENEPFLGECSDAAIEDGPRATLVHEMMHFAHIELNGFDHNKSYSFDKDVVREEVSIYGAVDVAEAIAEIGTGIIFGHEFPDEIHALYERHDGPEEVYKIGEAVR